MVPDAGLTCFRLGQGRVLTAILLLLPWLTDASAEKFERTEVSGLRAHQTNVISTRVVTLLVLMAVPLYSSSTGFLLATAGAAFQSDASLCLFGPKGSDGMRTRL